MAASSSVKRLSSEVAAEFFVAASGNEEAAETEHQRTDIYQQDEAQNDFDWAVREMALTIQAAGRVEEAIDSWIDTENTKHAIAARVEEVEKEISTEMLCGLDVPETETNVVESGKQLDGAELEGTAENDNDNVSYESEDAANNDDCNKHQPSGEEIEEIVTKIMTLSVEVEKFGQAYLQPQIWLNDAAEAMRRIHRMTAPVVNSKRATSLTAYYRILPKKNSKKV